MKTLLLALLSLPLMAQYTTISDTIYTPFGTTTPASTPTLWSGRIEVYAQCSMSYLGVTYERGARVVAVNSTGAFTINLIPNLSATVSACFNGLNVYLVKFLPYSGGDRYEMYWAFAASATPLTIADVRVSNPPPTSVAVTLTGDVTGTGSSTIPTTLANSGVTAGTYTCPTVTVNAKGIITSISSGSCSGGGGGGETWASIATTWAGETGTWATI